MPRTRPHLASLVDDFARLGPDIAVVAPRGLRKRRITYAQLATLSRRFAAELIARGIAKGERVLIWGENGPEWMATFFGCVLRGVLPVPLDAASTPDFVRRVGQEVTPRLIVGDEEKISAAGLETPSLAFDRFNETISGNPAGVIEDLKETDAVQIVFTSGTTGEPKGIVHTHKNVLASLEPIEEEIRKYLKYERIFHPIRFLHTLPLSHVFGQFMGLWIPPLFAAEVHYESRLVASEVIERIRRERISVLAAVPRVLDLLRDYIEQRCPFVATRVAASKGKNAWTRWWHFRDVHRFFGLKFWAFICGGAALRPETEQFWNALGFIVVQGYGMTETTALVSLNHPFRAVTGTIGQVLPGREVRLSDDGEVLVRGETISNAVWQAGQLRQGETEWLATGDLAEFDENGNLRFRGRKKDVIVTSAGLNIYPDDLEAALMRQAGVKTTAVIEANTDHGPEPVAVIVMNSSSDASSAVAAANKELAEFQQIRRWTVWPDADLPRTSTGKVLKREVARRIQSGETGAALSDMGTGDLNLDSLARVELQAQLEQQYGVVLDDTALQQVRTTDEVRNLIAHAPAQPPQTKGNEHWYLDWPWNPLMHGARVVFLETIAMPVVRFLAKPKTESKVANWPSIPILIV
ncbi:MAG: AMP-binding protein, partial [Acidobacteriaceae bacterium]|nr:AMP-binding protein [Acidobacteriaceae bacterium]